VEPVGWEKVERPKERKKPKRKERKNLKRRNTLV
jgi:hypothetical protein